MTYIHLQKRTYSILVVFLVALLLPLNAIAKKGGNRSKKIGGLSITNTLFTETGIVPGIAEGNETLIYNITVNNKSGKAKTISLTETVPFGTQYAGSDNFSSVCTAGETAGTSCMLDGITVPRKGSVTLVFRVVVDDPVSVAIIDNTVTASGIDCIENDCSETVPTAGIGSSTGFQYVDPADWSETSVRKVLHAFAYGGLATDTQIKAWAVMDPAAAVAEMLTFTYTNNLLSPVEDASSAHATSLQSLQNFWGDPEDTSNPMRWDKVRLYPTLTTTIDGITSGFNRTNLQRTFIQAVNTRGINPFLHKVAFYLTNYQMAIRASLAGNGLFRDYYDQVLADLVAGSTFTEIIANAAKSAAVARRYHHQNNTYNNNTMIFSGNDDFAREYFQLFFRYNGINESIDYHEDVNIENNAELLTGMNIDRLTNAYGSNNSGDWYVAPILFTDHVDETGRNIRNMTRHHADCLEIFHQMICGTTAAAKIDALSQIVAADPEVQDNLPVYIISHFADDRLTNSKKSKIRAAWLAAGDDLLTFLRDYAASKTFHSEDTVKFRTTFNRNLTLYNSIVLDNEEAFIGRYEYDTPRNEMRNQGGEIFQPAHDVFGGQTGLDAAGNPNIFKAAYDAASSYTTTRLARTNTTYNTDASGATQATWDKDWGSVIPTNGEGQYVVGEVADWLWQRIVGDGGKNFDVIARSQVLALLARGYDFGYVVTVIDPSISTNPDASYSSMELESDTGLVAVMDDLTTETLPLDDTNITSTRRTANRRVNYAANYIAMLPYTFALEGK